MNLSNNKNLFFLLLTVLTSACFLWSTHDVAGWLAAGDHGLHLYAFESVLRGAQPYRDFEWFYGPFMIYYYAAFIKLFGSSISVIIFAQGLLQLLSTAFIFLTLNLFVSPVISWFGASYFLTLHKQFFYSYNHDGGVLAGLAVVYFLLKFLQMPDKKIYWFWSLVSICILGLVKINFGIISWVGLIIICLLNQKRLSLSIIAPIILLAIFYTLLLNGINLSELTKSLQYFGNDVGQATNPGILSNIQFLAPALWYQLKISPASQILALIFLLSLILTARQKQSAVFLPLTIFIFFYALYLHEFILSGLDYRRYWADGFFYLLIFLIIGLGWEKSHPITRKFLIAILILNLGVILFSHQTYLQSVKTSAHQILLPKTNIYINNDPAWIQAVNQTAQFLNQNLPKDELFFALPYEPLFYYLTNRPSPTRNLVFGKFMKTSLEEEKKIIQTLEEKKVNWIILSNRAASSEAALGIFGIDYCPQLAEYLFNHFEMKAQYGDWVHKGGWAWNYGVRIYKRNLSASFLSVK